MPKIHRPMSAEMKQVLGDLRDGLIGYRGVGCRGDRVMIRRRDQDTGGRPVPYAALLGLHKRGLVRKLRRDGGVMFLAVEAEAAA